MCEHILAVNPAINRLGSHDSSAVLYADGELIFGIEEERLSRQKHAVNTFPERAIRACLDYAEIGLGDVSRVIVPWQPRKFVNRLGTNLREGVACPRTVSGKLTRIGFGLKEAVGTWVQGRGGIERALSAIGTPTPEIRMRNHHQCHAASTFYPSPFEQALVITLDGYGEHVSTAIWVGTPDGLELVREYDYPNSLGLFFGAVTQFLGFYPNNGEGKVMGLAPYGEFNTDFDRRLRSRIHTGVDYDVTSIVSGSFEYSTRELERALGRDRKSSPTDFTQWEKDLAFTAQYLLEEIVTDITEHYCHRLGLSNVALAGGVALNCKMNKGVMELDCVDDLFVQPVAHDAGSALGAGMLEWSPTDIPEMETVYWGPEYSTAAVVDELERNKIGYTRPEELERNIAERLADGELVGWFQNRLEMGPRALGNRSILADPREKESLDRVNEFVKHREPWRPFAPSMLETAVDEYLVNGEPAPYMIKTFNVFEDKKEAIPAVLHPADDTTRPQTVTPEQNPRYHRLISEFADITGVPLVLNTSFNDSGEPIVNRPAEAIKAFFGMGLDVLVLNDVIVEK